MKENFLGNCETETFDISEERLVVVVVELCCCCSSAKANFARAES